MMPFKDYYLMKCHHLSRLNLHINLVRKYLQKMIDEKIDGIDNEILNYEIKNHDITKIVEPELTPYCLISWFYKCQRENVSFEMTEEEKEATHQATVHHVSFNKHHAEFWAEDKTNIISRNNRDEVENLCDSTKMPLDYICCMCADWLAMAEEKGTNAIDWADKTVNKRWKFTDQQVELIYKLLTQFGE